MVSILKLRTPRPDKIACTNSVDPDQTAPEGARFRQFEILGH